MNRSPCPWAWSERTANLILVAIPALAAGSGVRRTLCPAAFFAHRPRGGTGMWCRSHNLPSPRPERPSSLASVFSGVVHARRKAAGE